MWHEWSTLERLIWLKRRIGGGASWVWRTITGAAPLTLANAVHRAIHKLTQYGKCEQRNLPHGYTQLDYIEGNGTAYIDTGVLLSNTDVFEITFQSLNALASPVMGAISGGTSYTSTNNLSVTYTTNIGLSAYSVYCDGAEGNVNYAWNGGNRADGLKHTIKYNGLNIAPMLDGVAMTQVTSHTLVESTPTVTTWLFGRNSTSTGTLAQSGVRIFDVNIQSKGHFIPAKRNSDNVVGMYDLVTGQFFTNAGTGSFTAGPVATPTPDAPVDIVCNNGAIKLRRPSGMPIAYQMVEWLKPTGPIAITGFKTKSTQEIETVFYRERSGQSYLYSSDTATSGTTNTTAYLTSGAGNWRWDGKSYSIGVQVGIKFTSIQNKDGVWFNGTRTGWYTDAGEFVSTNDLRLSSNENTTVRIYSMTIREGETVTLDLVPVQRVTDNAYGFYDKVSGNFYTNADATFDAGDQIDDPVEIYTDGTDEVLTVSGKNLINPDAAGVVNGSYISDSGNQVSDNMSFLSDYILVAEGETYTAQGYRTSGTATANLRVHGFDDSKTWTQMLAKEPMLTDEVTSASFTIPSGVKYVRVCGYIGYRSGRDAMLELGSTATAYEPYTTQTVSVPMLLGVGNYKDEAELISGIKTGKVGVKVFDGTEDWIAYTSSTLVIQNATSDWGAVAGVGGYCTHLTVLKAGETTFAGACRFATAFNVYEYKTAFGVADVAGFKAKIAALYAAGTPVIILYPLATETTEQGTAHELHTSEGTNVVDVVSNVDPVDLSVEYASNN